jgi:hypothetical protein
MICTSDPMPCPNLATDRPAFALFGKNRWSSPQSNHHDISSTRFFPLFLFPPRGYFFFLSLADCVCVCVCALVPFNSVSIDIARPFLPFSLSPFLPFSLSPFLSLPFSLSLSLSPNLCFIQFIFFLKGKKKDRHHHLWFQLRVCLLS